MKAEINNENKAKFLALYWGLNVVSHSDYPEGSTNFIEGGIIKKFSEEDYFICLKPLSQISDEDAIKVAELFDGNLKKIDRQTGKYGWASFQIKRASFLISFQMFNKGCIANLYYSRYGASLFGDLPIRVYDYLRSKGYALPWMGLSVEEMIEAGWIKLAES